MKRVITYGTFDMLHYGHINILRRAKEMGDYLVVVLSTDEFNWNSKQKKCYFTYEQRKQVLEAITAAGFECEAQDGEEQAVPYADWSAEKQAEYKLQAADLTTQGSAADTVSADMTQVDALSGATITSTAVTDIVNNSYFYVTEVLCAE